MDIEVHQCTSKIMCTVFYVRLLWERESNCCILANNDYEML